MQLIVYLDPQGLVKVDLSTSPAQNEEAHRFFQNLRSAIEKLGMTAREVGHGIMGGEDEAA